MIEKKHRTSRIDINDPVAVYKQLFRPIKDGIPDYVTYIDINSLPSPDFPHSLHHIETVRNFSVVMADVCKLDTKWRKTLDIAVTYHDVSQGFTIKGPLPIGAHPVSSSLISYMFSENIDASNLIFHHDAEIIGMNIRLNEEQDTAQRIIRDADRLAHMGYAGLIRAVYYWGFRHKLLETNPEAILQAMVLCDPRCNSNGLPDNHEHRTRLFVLEHVFPFLIETQQLDRAINHVRTNFDRFFGTKKRVENFLGDLERNKSTLKEISCGKAEIPDMQHYPARIGNTQKLDSRYSNLFILKPFHDFSILTTCKYILFIQSNEESPVEAKKRIKGLLDNPSIYNIY
jgi:hypothetical protein